jgi:adenylosuccinate lyase
MAAWQGQGRFAARLNSDPEITRFLSVRTIDCLFDAEYHLKHVDTIFRRVFGQ